MHELETSLHLFQPPLYRYSTGHWSSDFRECVGKSADKLTIDTVSIASILSFGWAVGDRTLLSEMKRRPWLSEIGNDGKPVLKEIPKHGTRWHDTSTIARTLLELLSDEARLVCTDRKDIYILLTGGLDSRIIAGVLARLYRQGELLSKPIALTWGSENSRDALYASRVAEVLGLEWHNISLGPDDVLENIKSAATNLGCLHTPECMHSSLKLNVLPKKALVLAGSYGDSIGRAEFGGRHLLELSSFSPVNMFGLLRSDVFAHASNQILEEFALLHRRSAGEPNYVLCEHEMQGFRMRGALGHAMTVVNKFCSVYQMFTSPKVYGYMWSLHPALRTDNVYGSVLEQLGNELAGIPWARTNKALKGKTLIANTKVNSQYHEYTKWSSVQLYDRLHQIVQPEWFEATGLFEPQKIRELASNVKTSQHRVGRLNEIWLWLASFRYFVDELESSGKSIKYKVSSKPVISSNDTPRTISIQKQLLKGAAKWAPINNLLKGIRKAYRSIHKYNLRRWAIRVFPPEK